MENTLAVLASPPHVCPSEAVPHNAWFARWNVSCPSIVPDVGDGETITVGDGDELGLGVTEGDGLGVGDGLDVGLGVGDGVTIGDGLGVGVGDGGGAPPGMLARNEV